METNHTHDEAVRAKKARNGFFIALLLSLTINIGQLGLAYYNIGKDRTVIKNQFIGDNCVAWVNDFEASKCYLEGLAFGDAVTLNSLHSSNGKLVQERMLSRTHASFKSDMKRYIYEQVTEIREKNYSFAFYPSNVYADTDTQSVYVNGTLEPKLGTTPLDPEDLTLVFKYKTVSGEALISNFYEYHPKG